VDTALLTGITTTGGVATFVRVRPTRLGAKDRFR